MYRGSLFEKLTGTLGVGSGASEEEALYRSVANNISKIFSTNAGNAQSVPDYGRPDLNNISMSMKDSIDTIERSSEICIRKYEPRLFKTKVTVSKDKLQINQMNVFIEGYMHIKGKSKKIYYQADLLSNGKVKVYKHES